MSKKHKVLYVDDEQLNLSLFTFVFKKKFEVLTALSGDEGLKLLENNKDAPIVISDMRMPGMNGIEFISKAREKYGEKIFYILTGFEITDEISKALEQQLIKKYFKKPFNTKEIESSVAEELQNLDLQKGE